MADAETLTEADILLGTLLPPSGLPTILSMTDFKALFPANIREHPQIPALYRALQHQRALDLDFVRDNIDAEAKRGERQQRELLRSKVKGSGGAEMLDVEETAADGKSHLQDQTSAMDNALYSQYPSSAYEPHTLSSIIPAMDNATQAMNTEVFELNAAAEQLQTQLEVSIGDLSDLRYGKLSRPGLKKEVTETLKILAAECDRKGANEIEM